MGLSIKGYRVLVEPEEVEKVSAGGIIQVVDDSMEEKLLAGARTRGTIVGIGSTAWKAHEVGPHGEHIGKPWAKVGDRVIYSQYGGTKVIDPVTEKEYWMVGDDDIAAVVTDDEVVC